MKAFKEFINQLKLRSGIHREDMPQIPKNKYDQFISFVRSKGIIVEEKINVRYELLSIIQNTFKSLTYEELKKITDMTRPILISRDNFILDGHHRYLIGVFDKNDVALCTKINLNVKEALQLMHEFENKQVDK